MQMRFIFLLGVMFLVSGLRAQPETARLLLEKGRDAYTNKEWDSAVRFFTAAYQADPQSDTALYNRAAIYVKQEKYTKAIADLTNFLTANPADAQAYVLRSQALTGDAQLLEAVKDLDMAISLHPRADWHMMRAQTHIETGNYYSAELDYKEVLRRNPNTAEAYRGLGDAHYYRNDFIAAQLNYQEAVRLAPYDPFSLLQYGIAQARLGNYQGALSTLTAPTVQVDPALALTTRAFCHLRTGDLEAARQDANQAKSHDISHAQAYHILGMIAAHESQLTQAVELFDECIAIDAAHAEAWYNGGVALYNDKRFDRANTYLNHALEYPEVKGAAAMALANLHLTLRDGATACQFFQLASSVGYEAHPEENTEVFCK